MQTNLPDEAMAALEAAADALGCEAAILAAILSRESRHLSGRARLEAHRFERHVFKQLAGYAVASHAAAVELDPELAEQASSHGAPQIMGWHAHMLGYSNARAMKAAFHAGGWPEQLQAMGVFLEKKGLAPSLRALDFDAIASAYNGRLYARNGYGVGLRADFHKISGRAPARVLRRHDEGEEVLELQRALVAAGFTTNPDRVFGPDTERVVRRFQAAQGLPVDGVVGERTWRALAPWLEEPAAAVETPATQTDVELDRAWRHRGLVGILGSLATTAAAWRAELERWGELLGVELGAIGRRFWAQAQGLDSGDVALLGLLAFAAWQFTPRAARALRRWA